MLLFCRFQAKPLKTSFFSNDIQQARAFLYVLIQNLFINRLCCYFVKMYLISVEVIDNDELLENKQKKQQQTSNTGTFLYRELIPK